MKDETKKTITLELNEESARALLEFFYVPGSMNNAVNHKLRDHLRAIACDIENSLLDIECKHEKWTAANREGITIAICASCGHH